MTNDVQLQNGYTRIANEILEALARTDLNGTQRRIIDVVIRQTDGYQRKEHEMSLNFISIATNIHKMQIQRELTSLIDRKIITVVSEASFNKSRMMALNKNYNSWLNSEQLTKKLTVSETDNHTVSEKANTTVSELANQIKKKENTKEIYSTFFEELWSLYPSKVGKGKISDTRKKELYILGDEFKRCISRYINYVKVEREKGFTDLKYQNGSTFFNSGYVDYLDENYKEAVVEPLDDSNWRGSDKRL
ncbi:replication protein [uncultured Tissierella sp.]|uniref:replication protein n=1 Tax=uncultured Tissierella sp. TaxID=448160 RepID=UPI002804EA4F|nr:replication protein [uncultured Tissierella sp.]MDU5081988.1 replication protein [Bacillota bacterium]